MRIDHAQLRALAAVIREGSFDRAAQSLNVTPSAISQRVKALEDRIGRLLVKRGTPATATAEGQLLVQLAEQTALLEHDALHRMGLADEELADTARRLRAAGVPLLLVDVTVHLADSERTAQRRIEKLDRREPADDDTLVFAGTGESLARTVSGWQSLGKRLHPRRVRGARNAAGRVVDGVRLPAPATRGAPRAGAAAARVDSLLGTGRARVHLPDVVLARTPLW